jgi:hypothetical protein
MLRRECRSKVLARAKHHVIKWNAKPQERGGHMGEPTPIASALHQQVRVRPLANFAADLSQHARVGLLVHMQ